MGARFAQIGSVPSQEALKPIRFVLSEKIHIKGWLVSLAALALALKARQRGLRETCFIGFGTAIATLLHRQKTMRAEAFDAKSRLQLALDAAQFGTFEWDIVSKRHIWDSRTEKLFGFEPGTFPQTREAFMSRIHPEDVDRVSATASAALDQCQDLKNEYRILLPNGEIRWVLANGRAYYDEQERPIRVVGVVQDITERKEIEAKLFEAAERVDLALKAGKIGVFEMDLRRPEVPVQWSERQYEIFEMDPTQDALKYETFRKKVHPDDLARVDREYEASLRERRDFNLIYRILLDDQRIRWIQANARAFFNGNGKQTRMIGTNIDVTDAMRAQEAVSHALKAREEMLAIVSHDLRSPLGSVLMSAAMIQRKAAPEESFVRTQALRIQRAGERMNEMIEDLLNLAKIEAGNFTLTKRDVCGCDVVTEAVETMSTQAEEKHIKIETSGADQPLQMSCDHNQVLRVFSNLIGNAIKFTPEGGSIKIAAEDRGSEVLFLVSDTGPGIAEHHIAHVFDRFWQASKTQHMGTGLGLAISKGIVEAHGGKIWVNSRFGHGATFYFTLPKSQWSVSRVQLSG